MCSLHEFVLHCKMFLYKFNHSFDKIPIEQLVYFLESAQVCGATVLTGAEWEPVLLTVVRPFLGEDGRAEMEDEMESEEDKGGFQNGGPGLKREARGFAGASTLGEVREALGEPKESLLCQEHKGRKKGVQGAGEGGGASGWRLFPPDDMQRTLKELSLKDGDALLVLEPQSFDSRYHPLQMALCACLCFSSDVCFWFLRPPVFTSAQYVYAKRRHRHRDNAV